jgi:hypothetical protein
MDDEKAAAFAAAAAAHGAQQVEVLEEALGRLRDKADRFEQLAGQIRSDIEVAETALEAARAEQAEWATKAADAVPAELTETTTAEASVAEALGEAKL